MRKMMIFLIMSLFPIVAQASPFGLKMGMTLKQIAKESEGKPQFVKNDAYMVKLKKSHPLFEYYFVFVDSKKGLYRIKAVSSAIKTNRYGIELQNSFYDLKGRISKTYGEPQLRDELDSESIFTNNEYWMYTLKDGARTLLAIWNDESSLKDDLSSVFLECSAISESNGFVILHYYFKNADSIEDDQDSVF